MITTTDRPQRIAEAKASINELVNKINQAQVSKEDTSEMRKDLRIWKGYLESMLSLNRAGIGRVMLTNKPG